MLNKMLKIVACCIFACSLSYNGNTSNPEGEESLPPLPSPIPLLDLDLPHPSLDQASSAPAQTEISVTAEEPTSPSSATSEKRKVKRVKSVGPKDNSVSPSSSSEKRKVKRTTSTGPNDSVVSSSPDKSKNVTIHQALPIAELFSNLTYDTKPRVIPSKSKNLFAPKELLPVHLLLALLAHETKVSRGNFPHPIVYLPDCGFYIGYKDMIYSTLNQLKEALKFKSFENNPNLITALELLCICGEEDFKKILNEQDMEVAKSLIQETQTDQWYQTHVKAILSDANERHDANTVGCSQGQENTKSNSTSYALYYHGKLLEPTPVTDDTSKKSKKSKKDKKKIQSDEKQEPNGIQVSLSVTKFIPTKKASNSKNNESSSTTTKKRAKSKGANPNAASSSAPSPSQIEEDSQSHGAENDEKVTEPSLQPQKKGE